MASKRGSKLEITNPLKSVKEETLQGIIAIIFFVIAIFSILAVANKAGLAGRYFYNSLDKLFGIGYYLLPIIFVILGIAFLRSLEKKIEAMKIFGTSLLLISSLGLIDLIASGKSGIIGHWISLPVMKLVDFYASLVIFTALVVISLLITFEARLTLNHLAFLAKLFKRENKEKKNVVKVAVGDETYEEELDGDVKPEIKKDEDSSEDEAKVAPLKEKKPKTKEEPIGEVKDFVISARPTINLKPFTPPPLSLLERDKGKPEVGDIKANANIIKRTLQNFGITVEMDEISIGPSVTRYALKPAEGVKLAKIVGLSNDLALALAAHPIRIEAPIPGKSLVGIEIPNTTKTTIGLASLLSTADYQESDKPLLVALGKSVTGKSYFANIAKMPHGLIAGATGSGKSVTIHAIITSLLFRNSPENLKFIMIDPKRVELTLYNKIPHLLTPVITEAKKAILALKWAAKEMDRRYNVLEANSVRDIESYHKNILAPELKKLEGITPDPENPPEIPETMPYIVVVIDELADIMQAYPRELESAIVRLAQMSRAVGIHLLLSTQRPSVNVITGLIKANVPARIALQVSSQIDSRTILDTSGAEKLLGAGDMLYLGSEMQKPVRLQSAFISETELKKVVKYLADTYADEIQNQISLTSTDNNPNALFESSLDDDDADEDDMYEEARQIVIEAGKASTSYLQRKLRIGYARAARLMDILESRGVIGPADGAKPREIIGGSSAETAASDEENSTNFI